MSNENCGTTRGYSAAKCRFANARPEPDFKYRSNLVARIGIPIIKLRTHETRSREPRNWLIRAA